MRYLVLSDIHSNHLALEAVLHHAKLKRWEKVIFLGDAVGYYTHPNEVVDKLRELEPAFSILGNHEALLLKEKVSEDIIFKEDSVVAEVIKRQVAQLSSDNLEFIKTFQNHVVRDGWEVTHGALRSQWEYITTLQNAQANLPLMKTDLCFVGHTHVPKVYAHIPEGDNWRTVSFRGEQSTYRLPPKARVIFNPGSVGQPRDGIPLASYALFDEDNRVIELFRVPYDVTGMQRNVREMGYPEALAARLSVGK
ncbi:MAG: metallophosphoesterase family protein [Trueperaceae bacterium]